MKTRFENRKQFDSLLNGLGIPDTTINADTKKTKKGWTLVDVQDADGKKYKEPKLVDYPIYQLVNPRRRMMKALLLLSKDDQQQRLELLKSELAAKQKQRAEDNEQLENG